MKLESKRWAFTAVFFKNFMLGQKYGKAAFKIGIKPRFKFGFVKRYSITLYLGFHVLMLDFYEKPSYRWNRIRKDSIKINRYDNQLRSI